MTLSDHIEKIREHANAAATASAAGDAVLAKTHLKIIHEIVDYIPHSEEAGIVHALSTLRLQDAQAAARVSALNQRQPIDLSRSIHPIKKL